MKASISAWLTAVVSTIVIFTAVTHGISWSNPRWRRDARQDVSNTPSWESSGEFVVTNKGVPHRHHGHQVADINEKPSGHIYPESVRLEQVQNIVDNFIRHNPDAPAIDLESILDLSDAEIRSVLKRISPNPKRFIEADESERWTGGYVPFIYTSSITPDQQKEIEIAMWRMEKYTCIRFIPWVPGVTRTEYNLDHDGYIRFEDGDGCYSVLGNNRNANGQKISCCGRGTCTHELGHVLGQFHEQNNPLSVGWVRVNWENIKQDYWSQYKSKDAEDVKLYNYDITSPMHYGTSAFNSNGRKTMTILFPELSIEDNIFYQFFEIVDSHDCKGLKCPSFNMTCENDGYISFVDGACSCMCPYGLDSTTGCTRTITQGHTTDSWPGESYAMLAPAEGCPGNNVFSEGEVTHWSRGGSYESSSFHLKGSFLSKSTNLHFCVIGNNGNSTQWPPGDYCIHRVGGQCPQGFDEGYIQFDDVIRSAEENNSNSGSLPDGAYDHDTLFYFCCRDDGFKQEPLELPNQDPLVLYRYDGDCPSVKGMFSTEEYYYFYNYNGDDTIATSFGAHPKLYKSSSKKYKTYFCYYTPYTMDCGGVIVLNDSNPSAIITSPQYPSSYSSATECNWLIKGPENSTILFTFDDFEIEEVAAACRDSLEIRHSRIGQPGIKYCGTGMGETIRSIFNMVSMTFRSDLTGNEKGFNLTVSYVKPEDHCYNLEDKGKTYRGHVNFTRDMKPCLPWATTTACKYSAVNERYFNDGLDGNYCRNPGDGLRPWCYTGYSEKDGCLRNYCDVCLKEGIYDAQDNCAELKTMGNFCDEDPQAFSGCAKTCADSFPPLPTIEKASDITCNAPAIPCDGVLVSPDQTTYNVGDTVKVRCDSSNDTVTATCHTDRSWNLGNYICGVCPDDWTPHSGYCFKYFHEELNHGDATARCAEFGGIIAPAATREEFDYIVSHRFAIRRMPRDGHLIATDMIQTRTFLRKMWLGADDKQTEGTWLWQDGTQVTWTLWANDEPDNRSNEDCAYVNAENKNSTWKDTYCSSYFTNFVCRMEVSQNTTCVDRQDDCSDIFEINPRSCVEFQDFARQECPVTCGLCGDTSCAIPQQSSNTEVLSSHMSQTLSTGEFISYTCADGYIWTDGNLERGCKMSGQLTGEAPVCKSSDEVVTPNNNVELKSRGSVGSTKYVYTGPMPEFNITKTGEITEWRFYTKYAGDVGLQVWRQTDDDSYTFIGQNMIETDDNRMQTVRINQTDRIPVEIGDFIGVYYGAEKGGICYSYNCDDADGMVIKSDGRISDPSDFNEGTEYAFRLSSLRCRVFSLTAMVGPRLP